jgi:putative NADPH-quinone reductase
MAQFTGGQMPQDVLDQQEKISQSDAVAFIYPTIGYFQPAILWGWQARVFSYGFAYQASEKGMEALLSLKKGLCISTTILPEELYQSTGVGAAAKTLIGAVFWTFGIHNYDVINFYTVQQVDDDARKQYLATAYQLGKEF